MTNETQGEKMILLSIEAKNFFRDNSIKVSIVHGTKAPLDTYGET